MKILQAMVAENIVRLYHNDIALKWI